MNAYLGALANYGVLKSADEHLRFTFITGVTKFSQVSVFRQIDDKGYATPYLGSGKQVVKVGVAFDSEIKNIDRWVVG